MRALAAVVSALVPAWAAWVFAPLVTQGYFLSDDFVPLALFEHWREQGRLAAALGEKFWSGLDAGGNRFFRPLSYLAFAANYVANGTDAAPWMAVNVAIHLANGLLVALVACFIAEDRITARGIAAGAAGAAIFLFFAASAEVVAWVSGRFDGFATFFTLLSCALFLRSRRAGDVAAIASLVAAAAAMLSKESAAILPFAIVLLAWLRAGDEPTRGARMVAVARWTWPWLALAAFYLGWRYFVFGSALAVYEDSRPLGALASTRHWHDVRETFPAWFAQQFRHAQLYPLLCVLLAAQLAVAVVASPNEARARRPMAVTLALALLTLALLLPHVGQLPSDGLGGRLLYQTAAFYAVFVGVALCRVRAQRTLWSVTIALAVIGAMLQAAVIERWLEAHRLMRDLVAEVARVGRETPPPGYALVFVPAAIDDIPFARNAQAGLMLPPIQREALDRRLLVQLYDELPLLADRISQGIVATMRERGTLAYLGGVRVPRPIELPTRALCWDSARGSLIALDVPAAATPQEWSRDVALAFVNSPCARSAGV